MPDGLLLSDWTTPQPFALPDLGPGVEGVLRDQLETALRHLAADPAVKALVLYSFGEACGYFCHESNVHHEH